MGANFREEVPLGSIRPPIDNILRVDQAPNQRLVFPLYGLFSSSRAFFYSGTLRFRPLVECSFAVILSTNFSFSPGKSGKTTLVGIEPRTSFVRL